VPLFSSKTEEDAPAPAAVEDVVWEGAEALRPFLVPIDTLEPFPGNPRRGDTEKLRGSLRRFGQPRPILTDKGGARIVAGHHVVQAAAAEGWTHVAAIPNEFETEEDARAFLLADNRLHDLGPGYDTEALYASLRALTDANEALLDGTGYDPSYLAKLEGDLEALRQAALDPSVPPVPDPAETIELTLTYTREQRTQLDEWLKVVASERDVDGLSESVYEAAHVAARHLNQT
jgi:ParB-like chromosome segregation protein Spo0J